MKKRKSLEQLELEFIIGSKPLTSNQRAWINARKHADKRIKYFETMIKHYKKIVEELNEKIGEVKL